MGKVFYILLCSLLIISCSNNEGKEKPLAKEITSNVVGYYSQMTVLDHKGNTAQIWLTDLENPIWFISTKDAIKFINSPEEADNILVTYIYVKIDSVYVWKDINNLIFVIGSKQKNSLGQSEAVPFMDKQSADKFIIENGGETLSKIDNLKQRY